MQKWLAVKVERDKPTFQQLMKDLKERNQNKDVQKEEKKRLMKERKEQQKRNEEEKRKEQNKHIQSYLNDQQFDYFSDNLGNLFKDMSEQTNQVDEIENRLIQIAKKRKVNKEHQKDKRIKF